MKKMSPESISEMLTGVFEDIFEDSACCPTSYSDVGLSEIFPEDELDVAAYFDGPGFMRDYCSAEPVIFEVKIDENEAELLLSAGRSCSDPALADEFIDRYLDGTRFPGIWKCNGSVSKSNGLTLNSVFEFGTAAEFRDELIKRIGMFADDRFTNELRPFLHYFDKE